LRLSAPQHQTALLVTYQEQRNETRLRQNAVRSGEDILYSVKTYDLRVGQASPVYEAGLTTVVTRPDTNGFLPDRAAVARREGETENPDTKDASPGGESSQAEEASQANQPTEQDLLEEEQILQNEDARLARNLAQAQLEKEQALAQGNVLQYQIVSRQESQLEQQKTEVEEQEQRNEQQKTEIQHSSKPRPSGLVPSSPSATLGWAEVLFGFSPVV
jgi:hypothetical protein